MEACETVLNTLVSQMSASFRFRTVDSGCLIETPFSYPDRRSLTVFVGALSTGEFELSDDGYAHSYARLSGVSDRTLKVIAAELAQRYNVDATRGEVVARANLDDLMPRMVSLIESSQRIADTVARKQLRVTQSRIDRQITTALVLHSRTYEPRGHVPIGDKMVDVDYNVLPTNTLQQTSLFAIDTNVTLRVAESIVYRIQQIQNSTPSPGFTKRVLLITDESAAFRDKARWNKVRDTLRDSQEKIIPITNQQELSRWLTA